MREVKNIAEMPSAIETARRESKSAFGDDNMYIEKVVENARHIEIQILADQQGNVIHLGERECSIQRRHQKLLEEAPSPFVGTDEEFRKKMGDMAVKAAQAVNYVNAGTVECLVDKHKNFYFLEMNTRLQVEHPVTELVTGIDIVKEQIRIARGRKLNYTQEEVTMKGWAVECRINAEDPYNNFMPSTGYLYKHAVPTGPGVRVDSGVYNGFTITPYYDSLMSKLITWGETRGHAILRLRRALEEYNILGVITNIPFHQNLVNQHRFLAGNFDTRFVEERFSMQKAEETKETFPDIAAIIATLIAHQQTERSAHIIQRGKRDTSNWKWVGRWERMHR
jgi:acetyl/propionyl-CoA carboxylase alpha subunit